MTDETQTRPQIGTSWRDLPTSPPIGETPPAVPAPPVAPPPPADSDGTARRAWPWLAALVLVVGGIGALLVWSPWSDNGGIADEDAALGRDNGSLFRDGDPFSDGGTAEPTPFPEDFSEGFGGVEDFLDQFEFSSPQDFLDQFGDLSPEDLEQFFDENFSIPPELLEEFGLPPDLFSGDLGDLLDQLPPGLLDRLESFEGFDRFGEGFRFEFGSDAFGVDYLPDGYEITSVRTESSGLFRPATEATIVANSPEGEIAITVLVGEAKSGFSVPAGAAAVEFDGGRAYLHDTGEDRRTLFFDGGDGDAAGSVTAPQSVGTSELVRIAEGVRHP